MNESPGKVLAIDYGQRYWGLAWADELGISLPIGALSEQPISSRWIALEKIVTQRRPNQIVVGYPLHMDGKEGKRTAEVDSFVKKLEEKFQLPIIKFDERLSTRQAEQGLSHKGKKKAKTSGQTDSRSAAIILSDYLNAQGAMDTF